MQQRSDGGEGWLCRWGDLYVDEECLELQGLGTSIPVVAKLAYL